MMTKSVDKELKKAIVDLKIKMVKTGKKIRVLDSQIGLMKRALHHVDNSRRILSILPPGDGVLTDLTQIKTDVSDLYMCTDELENNCYDIEESLRESEDIVAQLIQECKK